MDTGSVVGRKTEPSELCWVDARLRVTEQKATWLFGFSTPRGIVEIRRCFSIDGSGNQRRAGNLIRIDEFEKMTIVTIGTIRTTRERVVNVTAANEGRAQQVPNFLDAAIYSPRLLQAFCWLLVFFL
jgi:hypothetical protein